MVPNDVHYLTGYLYLCTLHFKKEDFVNSSRLRKGAVPTIIKKEEDIGEYKPYIHVLCIQFVPNWLSMHVLVIFKDISQINGESCRVLCEIHIWWKHYFVLYHFLKNYKSIKLLFQL